MLIEQSLSIVPTLSQRMHFFFKWMSCPVCLWRLPTSQRSTASSFAFKGWEKLSKSLDWIPIFFSAPIPWDLSGHNWSLQPATSSSLPSARSFLLCEVLRKCLGRPDPSRLKFFPLREQKVRENWNIFKGILWRPRRFRDRYKRIVVRKNNFSYALEGSTLQGRWLQHWQRPPLDVTDDAVSVDGWDRNLCKDNLRLLQKVTEALKASAEVNDNDLNCLVEQRARAEVENTSSIRTTLLRLDSVVKVTSTLRPLVNDTA